MLEHNIAVLCKSRTYFTCRLASCGNPTCRRATKILLLCDSKSLTDYSPCCDGTSLSIH